MSTVSNCVLKVILDPPLVLNCILAPQSRLKAKILLLQQERNSFDLKSEGREVPMQPKWQHGGNIGHTGHIDNNSKKSAGHHPNWGAKGDFMDAFSVVFLGNLGLTVVGNFYRKQR